LIFRSSDAKSLNIRVAAFGNARAPIDACRRQPTCCKSVLRHLPSVLQLIRTLPRIVVDEVDEGEHWLSILKKAELATGTELDWLLRESGELRAIFGKSLGTARQNANR
jgi:hypothetical protein